MFTLEKEPKFWAEVKVAVPIDDGHEEHTFRAQFKVRPASVVEKVDRLDQELSTTQFLKDTVVGLSNIKGDDGELIPFSAKLLDEVMDHYGARLAMWNTYIAAVVKARVGN